MEVLVIGIKEMQINEEITDKEVRLISNDGEQLGIVSAAQAQKLAAEKNLDLVKIAPQAKPPVCKIMDYGKYRFEQSKREKEAKKNQRVIEIKEIFRPTLTYMILIRKSVTPESSCRQATRPRSRSASVDAR